MEEGVSVFHGFVGTRCGFGGCFGTGGGFDASEFVGDVSALLGCLSDFEGVESFGEEGVEAFGVEGEGAGGEGGDGLGEELGDDGGDVDEVVGAGLGGVKEFLDDEEAEDVGGLVLTADGGNSKGFAFAGIVGGGAQGSEGGEHCLHGGGVLAVLHGVVPWLRWVCAGFKRTRQGWGRGFCL